MASLIEVAHEVLHHIFVQIDPADLAAVSASCKALHSYVTNNHLLFKELYLQFLAGNLQTFPALSLTDPRSMSRQ